MNMGKPITALSEGIAIPGESSYVVAMGDGTGVKKVKHKTLVEQLLSDMELPYDETLAMLTEEDGDGEENGEKNGKQKIPNLQAISDWIASKIVNSLLATEEGFFMDARQGPVLDKRFKAVEDKVTAINSDLHGMKFHHAWLQSNSCTFDYATMALIFVGRSKSNSGGFYMADTESEIITIHPASSAITVTCQDKEVTVSNNNVAVQTVFMISN